MPKRPLLIYFLLIGLVCFVGGFLSVLLPNRLDQNPSTSTSDLPAIATETTFTGYRSIAFIGVDELKSDTPELVALWFATVQPGEQSIQLTGVPLNYMTDDRGGTAAGLFKLPEPNRLDPQFHSMMSDIAPGDLMAYVIMDKVAFAGLVDYLGGTRLNNDVMDGKSATAVLEMLVDQPEAALTMQQTMLASLADQASKLSSTPELTPLMGQIPDHAYTSLPPAELATIAIPLLPITPAQIDFQLLPEDHRTHTTE